MPPSDPTAGDLPLDDLDAHPGEAALRHAISQGGDIAALYALSARELLQLARDEGLEVLPNLDKGELLYALLEHRFQRTGLGWVEGVLEVLPDGFGFLRSPKHDFEPGPHDVYVSPSQIRRLNLKPGHQLAGPVRPPKRGEKFFALLHVERVNDGDSEALRQRVPFAARTPLLPSHRLHLGAADTTADLRAIELLAPWGKGQRVLLTMPPGSRRTRLLLRLATALRRHHPELHVLCCLLDERPEEVTAIRRALDHGRHGDVVASTFDQPPARHIALAELSLARAQRMVEAGQDVVLVLDSLTALARAYHLELPPSGRFVCPGLDAAAVQRTKKLFGAARRCEEGGSLSILATALCGTESKVEQAVLEEFQNRGNSEVVFDRDLADLHLDPPLDVLRTGTRAEDNLLDPAATAALQRLRQQLLPLPKAARLARVLDLLAAAPDDAALLAKL